MGTLDATVYGIAFFRLMGRFLAQEERTADGSPALAGDRVIDRPRPSRHVTSPLITEGYPPVLVSSKLRVTGAIV
jgi:hypothetical protein